MCHHKRDTSADIAKGIGIVLVVMEHDHFIKVDHIPWQVIILSFHMPLFYFISGMFFNPNHSMREQLSRRFNSLLKPYLAVCLSFVVCLLLKNNDLAKFFQDVAGIVYGTGRTLHWPYGVLWFLPSLFCTAMAFFILHNFFLRKAKQIYYRWAVILSVLVGGYWANQWFRGNGTYPDLLWSLNLVCITTFFYALGYEFHRNLLIINKKFRHWFAVLAVLIMGGYVITTLNHHYLVLNLFYRRYDSLWVNTLEAISAIYLVLYCSIMLANNYNRISVFLSYIGERSLTIFMFHSFLLVYVSGAIVSFIDHDGFERFAMTVILTIMLCLFIHELLSRIPMMSFLFLNIKRKRVTLKGVK